MATSDTSIITRGFLKKFWDRVNGIKQNTVIDGSGLTFASSKLKHTNSVNSQATQAFYPISIDSEGHVSGSNDPVSLNHSTFSDNSEDNTDLDYVITLGQKDIELQGLTSIGVYRSSSYSGYEIKVNRPTFITPIKDQVLAVYANDHVVHIFGSEQSSEFIDVLPYVKYNSSGQSVLEVKYMMLNVDEEDIPSLPAYDSLMVKYTYKTENSILRYTYSLTQL